jgi:hypothetical protein
MQSFLIFSISNVVPLGLGGVCDVTVERTLTGSTTNTTAAAVCSVPVCYYDLTLATLNCQINFDLGGAELVKGLQNDLVLNVRFNSAVEQPCTCIGTRLCIKDRMFQVERFCFLSISNLLEDRLISLVLFRQT